MARLEQLEQQIVAYCTARKIGIELRQRLGSGQDGAVWETGNVSAVKALERRRNYEIERRCYERLFEHDVREIEGLAVPRLLGFDDDLQVIEMDIVQPPFLLDFGKAYLDERAPYDAEQLAEWHETIKELFEGDYPRVKKILSALWSRYGIDYTADARPANIRFR